jgi:hypothetical protein
MKTIFKYPFSDEVDNVPVGAKLLKVAYQGNNLFGWYLIDSQEERIKTRFYDIHGTGHPITNNCAETYIDTVFDPNGFVWHIFEYPYE